MFTYYPQRMKIVLKKKGKKKTNYLITATVGPKCQLSALRNFLAEGLYRQWTDGLPLRQARLVHFGLELTPRHQELCH